ncbi:MAG: hypothetical protein ACI4TK_08665 [Agathobacter sp.]
MTGKLAISKSGHDKDHLYVIVREDAEFVYLADGKLKTVEHPKKKNKKHIQIIKQIPEEVAPLICKKEEFLDLEIKRAIKLFITGKDA